MSALHNRINSKIEVCSKNGKRMSTSIRGLMKIKKEREKSRDECQANQFHFLCRSSFY